MNKLRPLLHLLSEKYLVLQSTIHPLAVHNMRLKENASHSVPTHSCLQFEGPVLCIWKIQNERAKLEHAMLRGS